MKNSAALASADAGGAAYVARKLADFCSANPGMIELHAAGHSAGAIFHSHFVPAALNAGTPAFETVQLLAPALRLDAFTATLKPRVPDGIRRLSVFTMTRDLELADNTLGVYRKSLLYLISRALESTDNAALVGLQDSLTNDPGAADFFGLSGNGAGKAQVIWSPTALDAGGPRGASGSTSHGGFDNDELTMNSVARRVLGRDDITPFPPAARSRAARVWDAAAAAPRPAIAVPAARDVRRSALCVGINAYAGANELFACVADAEAWARALAQRGFTTDLVTDRDATRDGILGRLADMVGSARPGDVLAFQFSGHGVEVPDEDGDRAEPGQTCRRQTAVAGDHHPLRRDEQRLQHTLGADGGSELFQTGRRELSARIERVGLESAERPRFRREFGHTGFPPGRLNVAAIRRCRTTVSREYLRVTGRDERPRAVCGGPRPRCAG
jgi:hypothetical protein